MHGAHYCSSTLFSHLSSLIHDFRCNTDEATEHWQQPYPMHRASHSQAVFNRLPSHLRSPTNTDEVSDFQQPKSLGLCPHMLLVLLSSLRRYSPNNDEGNNFQQPSTPSRLCPPVLLARLSSLLPRSQPNMRHQNFYRLLLLQTSGLSILPNARRPP
ncbi:hypothetical protein EDB19DRAFT_1774393 [Suillus lakei]|nr:hypothetical protein EDB19DRAFT_1774393 [Suillus lakei]